jgi:hypothetical protein
VVRLHAVVIDDRCDLCGPEARGRRGVVFKLRLPIRGFIVLCDNCITDARAQVTAEDLLRVSRDGPIIRIDHGVNVDLLEGIAAAAGVVVGQPDVTDQVRLAAAQLLTAIRHPGPPPDGSEG